MKQKIAHIVHKVFSLYSEFGHKKYSNEVSHLSHMVQTAQLAMGDGFDEEVIIAAFLHDIGHLYARSLSPEELESLETIQHEALGAQFLKKNGFSPKVVSILEGNLKAMRYMSLREEGYFEKLPEVAKDAVSQNGGKMTEEEAATFEQNDFFGLSLNLRYWAETATKPNQKIPNLAFIKEMVIRHLEKNVISVG